MFLFAEQSLTVILNGPTSLIFPFTNSQRPTLTGLTTYNQTSLSSFFVQIDFEEFLHLQVSNSSSSFMLYALHKHTYVINCIIIYPENCSIQIALVKTINRFPYCTESRKILSYCTGQGTFYRIAWV